MPSNIIQNIWDNGAVSDSIQIDWQDGHTDQFHYIWLRDNDPALRSKNGQINHDPFSLNIHIKPKEISHDSNALTIEWSDGHGPSRYETSWLAKHSYRTDAVRARRPHRHPWTAKEMDDLVTKHPYESISSSDNALRTMLQDVWDYGFTIIKDVPEVDKIVVDVARPFGIPRETNYGVMFELIGSPTAADRGHNNDFLPSHVDNPYRNPIPTLQLLHFMSNSVEGGWSTIVDGIRIAEEIRDRDPKAFELLTTVPVVYRYLDDDVDLSNEGPLIRTNYRGEILGMLASPINVQPLDCAPDQMIPFYKAYQRIGTLMKSPEFRFETKMNNGDLLVMDNTRVLHGRTSFQSDGTRRLQGCYADFDAMWSKLAVLKRYPV